MINNNNMLIDFYQLTMAQAFFKSGKHKQLAVFDMFFRTTSYRTYAIFAGLEQLCDYIKNLSFSKTDIEFLKSQKIKGKQIFSDDFLDYLKKFKFRGDIVSVEEGEVVFANTPLITVKASIIEAQIIETMLLNIVNFQTLIATKTARIKDVCGESLLLEFGLRRAQGATAGLYGSRASVIGGADFTSNMLCGQIYGVQVTGTHSHSFVKSFDSELEAFRVYADIYPDNCVLLIDTYDTLKAGLPNAITVFKELKSKGHTPIGVRIDSGDLAYLSKEARRILDGEGFSDTKIIVSGDLDENLILSLKHQGAKIDGFGVGTKLITSLPNASLGGVYKLSALGLSDLGELEPKIKLSNSFEKTTLAGEKEVVRIIEKQTNKAIADLIMLSGETLDESVPLTLTNPLELWQQITISDFYVKQIRKQIFKGGKLVYKSPPLKEIAKKTKANL
ncbi:MAG: nicotinate phosphoribosyltransferase, partial [Firmicutes bacterium]|nr:nicotinate phosphoribosyltransferase [Bacillota bacterium]